jgi:hypothetical protein
VNRDTASDYARRVITHFAGERRHGKGVEPGLEQLAFYEIEGLLKEAGIIE